MQIWWEALESIRRTCRLTVECGLSLSWLGKKTSKTAGLNFMLLKYCKIFDSLEYVVFKCFFVNGWKWIKSDSITIKTWKNWINGGKERNNQRR